MIQDGIEGFKQAIDEAIIDIGSDMAKNGFGGQEYLAEKALKSVDPSDLGVELGDADISNIVNLIRLGRIALIHSELSEAAEGIRKPGPSDKLPSFTVLEEELADAVIRILHMAYTEQARLSDAIIAKIAYNRSRPFRHGKTC